MTGAFPVIALLVLGSYTVGTISGFGSNVLVVTLASHLVPVDELLPVLMPLNVTLNLWLVARHRRHIDRRLLLRRILPLMTPGLAIGLAVLIRGPASLLKLALGAFVGCVGAVELLRALRGAPQRPLPRAGSSALLAAGGLFQGMFASGGPLVVWVLSRELPDKAAFRATLAGLWLLTNGAALATYAVNGMITPATLSATAPLSVPLALGIALGEVLHDRIDQHRFRLLVFSLLAAGGAALLTV